MIKTVSKTNHLNESETTMSVEVSIGKLPELPKAENEYTPVILKLIEAGPEQGATATFDSAEGARVFVRGMQAAARAQNKSAMKYGKVIEDDGKFTVTVRVRDKITRNTANKADKEASKK